MSQTALIDTNGLQATNIQIDQVLEIPDKDKRHNIYKIKSGDSLTILSKRYNIDINELARVNNLSPKSGLLIDSTLIIPAQGSASKQNSKAVVATRTLNVSEKRDKIVVANVVANKAVVANKVAATPTKKTVAPAAATRNNRSLTRHRVQYSELLSKIAKLYQVNVNSLAQANNMQLTDVLYFGQYLTLPNADNQVSSMATTRSSAISAPKSVSVPSKYVVRTGDTLMGVAKKFNSDFMVIAKLSGIEHYSHLAIGQTLTLPKNATLADSSSY